ncbi:hypothetical protein Q8A67_011485 [Cirrhinus molitorella]|uniref:Uncharacterized protein n=1 Tax=Cirrhinus molitorella TaxID=172907 RepID=A0AA88Q2I1_9TELE|nr:hypothetical protein Q8A67_011485 [Cirrhinus molitorella]
MSVVDDNNLSGSPQGSEVSPGDSEVLHHPLCQESGPGSASSHLSDEPYQWLPVPDEKLDWLLMRMMNERGQAKRSLDSSLKDEHPGGIAQEIEALKTVETKQGSALNT